MEERKGKKILKGGEKGKKLKKFKRGKKGEIMWKKKFKIRKKTKAAEPRAEGAGISIPGIGMEVHPRILGDATREGGKKKKNL